MLGVVGCFLGVGFSPARLSRTAGGLAWRAAVWSDLGYFGMNSRCLANVRISHRPPPIGLNGPRSPWRSRGARSTAWRGGGALGLIGVAADTCCWLQFPPSVPTAALPPSAAGCLGRLAHPSFAAPRRWQSFPRGRTSARTWWARWNRGSTGRPSQPRGDYADERR